MRINFTLADIRRIVGKAAYERGDEYARQQRVLTLEEDDDIYYGTVRGSGREIYEQDITLSLSRKSLDVDGVCSCPVGYNCKHVAAVLIDYLRRMPTSVSDVDQRADNQTVNGVETSTLPRAVSSWLSRLENEVATTQLQPLLSFSSPKKATAKSAIYRIVFALTPAHHGNKPVLYLCKARLRVNGELAAAHPVTEVYRLLSDPPAYMQAEDRDLVGLYMAQSSGNYFYQPFCDLTGKLGAQLLRMLLEQNRLLWANSLPDLAKGIAHSMQLAASRRASLRWGEQRDQRTNTSREALKLGWEFEPESELALHLFSSQSIPIASRKSIDYVLRTEPAWYIDNLSCGELTLVFGDSRIPSATFHELIQHAPLLDASNRQAVARVLLAQGLHDIIPLPVNLPQTIRQDVTPQPRLLLGSRQVDADTPVQDYAQLSFRYGDDIVSTHFTEFITCVSNVGIEKLKRNRTVEEMCRQTLLGFGMMPLQKHLHALAITPGSFALADDAAWLRFAQHDVLQLVKDGWEIEKQSDYRFDVSVIEDWYAEIDDSQDEERNPGNAWFDLELGIVVNQERVSLLPLLINLIRRAPEDFNPHILAQRADSDELLLTLSEGVRVALPWGRIKPILNTLGELYFTDKSDGPIRLSVLDAARLAELDAGAQLRWLGGERLRSMGKKLSTFGGVKAVATPVGLQATLRDYQIDGLAWMQFLREYDLAGILADDMGLGKTIQTLAHILIEKEAGRLNAPALVIAPTSLMSNWQDEAARFTPSLRVLLLQGKQRLEQFDRIAQYDLVLTTYALLPRDEEHLRAHTYHLLILDEAHYIKNARSKAAQSATLLRARHRLCLTGTPLENHLGELWSQFHFLLPGLLGDEKSFNRDFRSPIEKQGDDARRTLLTRRIKPFLLRRTKDKVTKELPPKTEMVRIVELSGAQRDLYETVRLAMDKKVRDAIAQKGMARSHIIILEALLKLRQACCDPRLLKTEVKKKHTEHSAKLSALTEMVEELREEGRRILIFSQFTSMLALIAAELEKRNISYALLTGETVDRAAAVRMFQQGEVSVFLISLKAGGVGLNLTAADTVIHYDPWWNPAAENQATDRAWRIGQDKPVFVYKLIAKGTVEEKIQILQQKKADLAQAMLSPAGETQRAGLTQDDLQAIFAPLSER